MGGFVRGDVVVVPFPYSDLTLSKRRPAVVIRQLPGDDVILCQITSKAIQDAFAVPVEDSDFDYGKLAHDSNIRPNRLFTADSNIILYRVGALTSTKIDEIIEAVVAVVRG